MKHRILLLLLCLTAATGLRAQEERSLFRKTVFTVNGASQTDSDSLEVAHQEYPADSIAALADAEHSDEELLELLRMMPNIEIGKGITFQPRSKWYSMTLRFRMQNMVGLSFDRDFSLTQTEARVKRLRLRFDGYIYSPKLVYSIQLGFTPYDTKELPNGNTNIVRDAIVYYVPNAHWNIGFGQTKIKANRARVNSSSALQFVDRSIVNSEFNLDRDFGFFGEYNGRIGKRFRLSAKGSITLGEGRNWSTSSDGGLAYTGRLELYPLGRFKSKGDVIEGDFEYDEQVRILLAGAYSYNSRAVRIQGQNGALMPEGEHRNLGAYFSTSSSSTAASPSIPTSWAARATPRSSTATKASSSTRARASTSRRATSSSRSGKSRCATRRCSPTARCSRWPATAAGTRPPSA